MTMDRAASVQGVALRVTKLASNGRPLAGDNTCFVTNAFMSLSFTPEYTDGDEIEEKGADGSVCISYKMPDSLKNVTLNLAICNPDPELYEMLAGGEVIKATTASTGIEIGDVVGFRAPSTGTVSEDRVAIEVWSKAIVGGKLSSKLPYFHWVFPSVKMRQAGDRVLENGAMANTFEGEGIGNADFAGGPVTPAWDYGSTDRAYQYARVLSLPSIPNNYVSVIPSTSAGSAPHPVGGFDADLSPQMSAAEPGDVFGADPDVTASSAPIAATLVSLGYIVAPTETAAWTGGEKITIGTFDFYWTGTDWAAGAAP